MANFNKAYGAGLRDAYVKDATGVVYDINAVVGIDADNDQTDTEVRGDDALKATFSSGRKETLTITANGVTFDTIAALTGNTATSSAGGIEIPLGTTSELNPPYVEIGGLTNGRSDDGTAVVLKKVFHKVQINSIVVHMEGETEFSVEMTGTAYFTDKTITAVTLSPARTSTLSEYTGQVAQQISTRQLEFKEFENNAGIT